MNIKSEEGLKEKNGDIIDFIGQCESISEVPSRRPLYFFVFKVKKVLKGGDIHPPVVGLRIYSGPETKKIFGTLDLKFTPYENREIKINDEIKNKEFIIKVKHIDDRHYKFIDIGTKK